MLKAYCTLILIFFPPILLAIEKHSTFDISAVDYLKDGGHQRFVAEFQSGKVTLQLIRLLKKRELQKCDIEVYRQSGESYEWIRTIKGAWAGKEHDCTKSVYKGYHRYDPVRKQYVESVEEEKLESSLNRMELDCLKLQLDEIRQGLGVEWVKSFLRDVKVSDVKMKLVTDREGFKKPEDLQFGVRIFSDSSDSMMQVTATVDSAGNCIYMSSAKIQEDLVLFSQKKEVMEVIELETSRKQISETFREIERSLKQK